MVPQEETHDAHTEADGQMNLFGSFAMQNSGEEAGQQETAGSCHIPDFLGLAVACGEEEICYVEASEALPAVRSVNCLRGAQPLPMRHLT